MAPVKDSAKERKTIGAFVARVGRAWSSDFMAGVTAAAEEHHLNLICFVGGKPTPIITPGHIQSSYGLYDLARTEQLAGIIVSSDLGYEITANEAKQFIENYSHIPMIANALQADGIPNLIGDNVGGMRGAVEHLIDEHG